MRRTLCVVMFALFCTLCVAQQNSAVGKWECVSDDGHGVVRQWTLTVNEAHGKLSGNIISDELTMPLLDPKLDGKALSFKTFVNPNCTILFEVNVDGKKLEGKFACPEVSGTLKGTRTS